MALAGVVATTLVALSLQSFLSSVLYLLAHAAPAVLFVQRLLLSRPRDKTIEWYPLGLALGALSLYGIGFCTFHEFFVTPSLQPQIETLSKTLESQYPEGQQKIMLEALHLVSKGLSGISTINMVIWTLISCYAAERFLLHMKLAIRPMPVLKELTLPWWIWIAFAATGVFWITFNHTLSLLSVNIFVFLGFIFFLHGLSIVHDCLGKLKNPQLKILIFYGSMLLLGWIVLSVVVLLGLFEPWINLRQKLSKKLGN